MFTKKGDAAVLDKLDGLDELDGAPAIRVGSPTAS